MAGIYNAVLIVELANYRRSCQLLQPKSDYVSMDRLCLIELQVPCEQLVDGCLPHSLDSVDSLESSNGWGLQCGARRRIGEVPSFLPTFATPKTPHTC